MQEFRDSDLSGARFQNVSLRDATFTRVDLAGIQVRGARFHGASLRGVELANVEINGELENCIVNGVDIGPLVEQELDRRMPDRAKMRAQTPAQFREAWAILERLWADTVARAQSLPEDKLHERVDGEWSFIQTLRHLGFATAAWIERMALGNASPWHPLDLPWEEAPGWDGIPWDREVQPSLDEVLALRAKRQAIVRDVMASLTDEQLASTIVQTEPGWPQSETLPFSIPLRIVVNEEWEHRLYAERDLRRLLADDVAG
jgi:uncharacterized damage-inducible protein DinB